MTNKTISITCDSDNVVALNAFSKALAEMAQVNPVVGELKYNVTIDTTEAAASLEHAEIIDTTAQQVESLAPEQYPTDKWIEMVHSDHNTSRMARSDAELEEMVSEGWVYPDASDDAVETVCVGTPTLDSDGLPWDSRIHSTNKATVADGTWRLRRKPKDLTEEQWQAEIKTVRDELEQLMAIEPSEVVVEDDDRRPGSGGAGGVGVGESGEDDIEPEAATVFAPVPPPVTVADLTAHVDVPAPVETVPVTMTVAPPVPVAPPATVSAPEAIAAIVKAQSDPVESMTFPKLMSFLTQHHGKITVEQVNGIVAKHGLTNIQQFAQRPDLIDAFVADVKLLLGE